MYVSSSLSLSIQFSKGTYMTQFTIESSPQVQYPLRLDHQLHDKFYSLSKRTKIPMSTLGRLSITKFLDEVDSKGITTVLNEMETL